MEKFEIEKIPKEWEKEKLNQISNIIMGQSPPSNSYNETGNGLPFYQGKTDFGFITPGIRLYCSNPKKIAEINDILISVRAPVGPVNINKIKSCIGRGLASIRSTNIYNLFLYYSLIFNEKKITELGTGSTFHSINKSQLENFIILKPPLPEQKKIAYVLSTIQKAIEKQDEIIQTTTELKKSMLDKLFTKGLFGEKQKETEIGLVPVSWKKIKIKDIGECITGTTPSTKNKEYWDTKDIDFITPADIGITKYIYDSERKISKKGFLVSRKLPKYSIVCVCIGSSIGKVGLTYKKDSCSNQQINSIICNSNYNAFFIYYLLLYYNNYWKTFATPSPVPILNKGRFEEIILYVTNNKIEQQQIAHILASIDNKIEYHTSKKTTLSELFKSMLHNLMTGRIRVNEINFDKMKEEQ